jgi:hypothetical protein
VRSTLTWTTKNCTSNSRKLPTKSRLSRANMPWTLSQRMTSYLGLPLLSFY